MVVFVKASASIGSFRLTNDLIIYLYAVEMISLWLPSNRDRLFLFSLSLSLLVEPRKKGMNIDH